MRIHLATAILSFAVGIFVWVTTTWLEVFDPAWRLPAAAGVALVTGAAAIMLMRGRASEDDGVTAPRSRTASGIRGRNVKIEDIHVKSSGEPTSRDIASDITARRDVDISKIRQDGE